MGASGAGKSTFLRGASFRSAANVRVEGDVELRGKVAHGGNALDRARFLSQVGFVPQHLDLVIDSDVTAAELLYFHARLRWTQELAVRGAKTSDTPRILLAPDALLRLVADTLKTFDLLRHAMTCATRLSGGQQRRLAIATECLRPTPCLFLDEVRVCACVFA